MSREFIYGSDLEMEKNTWREFIIKHKGLYTRIKYGGTYTVPVVGEKLPVLPGEILFFRGSIGLR